MAGKATRVVGYVRVSRRGSRDDDRFLSPDLQREQIASLAKRENLSVVDVLEEIDVSGKDDARPEWNRALALVESGEVQGIAVWNISRFSRSLPASAEPPHPPCG
jgi:site-specific DNA recombinase